MNILLWVLQVVLAWLCIAGGFFHVFKLNELQGGVAAMRSLPHGLWMSLGTVLMVAGVGLILPTALTRMPMITPVAAVVVAVHSVLTSAFYLYYGDRAPLPYSLAMAVIAAFIFYGRFVLKP